ncbi:hypothetical protein EDD85DRAFT_982864 [Armillaria nabsnona]|nr:hypothetical protein EDD85DRAFT_982864 [Armillaria nabsnona]
MATPPMEKNDVYAALTKNDIPGTYYWILYFVVVHSQEWMEDIPTSLPEVDIGKEPRFTCRVWFKEAIRRLNCAELRSRCMRHGGQDSVTVSPAIFNPGQRERPYGSHIRLLYHLFSVDGPFEISLQFTADDKVIAVFTVELNKHPVLFIQVKDPESFRLDSKRQEADMQMREQFSDLHDVVTSTLSFYQYDKATALLTPPAIAADLNIMNDAAPQSRVG